MSDEFGDAKEVVGRADQVSSELGAPAATISTSPKTSHGLDPSEDLLDAPADPLADGVTKMTYGTAINGGPAVRVLSDMRRDVGITAVGDEVGGIVAAVSSKRDAATSLALLEHRDGCLSFAVPRSLAYTQVDQQAVPILNQGMTSEG